MFLKANETIHNGNIFIFEIIVFLIYFFSSCNNASERQGDERGVEGEEARGKEELHDAQEESFRKFDKFEPVSSAQEIEWYRN
jgi:hypothetical protein